MHTGSARSAAEAHELLSEFRSLLSIALTLTPVNPSVSSHYAAFSVVFLPWLSLQGLSVLRVVIECMLSTPNILQNCCTSQRLVLGFERLEEWSSGSGVTQVPHHGSFRYGPSVFGTGPRRILTSLRSSAHQLPTLIAASTWSSSSSHLRDRCRAQASRAHLYENPTFSDQMAI